MDCPYCVEGYPIEPKMSDTPEDQQRKLLHALLHEVRALGMIRIPEGT